MPLFEVTKDYPEPNVTHTIRFTEPIHERLKQVAADNKVSFNKLVLMCCQYALDNMKPAEGDGQ